MSPAVGRSLYGTSQTAATFRKIVSAARALVDCVGGLEAAPPAIVFLAVELFGEPRRTRSVFFLLVVRRRMVAAVRLDLHPRHFGGLRAFLLLSLNARILSRVVTSKHRFVSLPLEVRASFAFGEAALGKHRASPRFSFLRSAAHLLQELVDVRLFAHVLLGRPKILSRVAEAGPQRAVLA